MMTFLCYNSNCKKNEKEKAIKNASNHISNLGAFFMAFSSNGVNQCVISSAWRAIKL